MLALNSFRWIRVLAGEVFCGFVFCVQCQRGTL